MTSAWQVVQPLERASHPRPHHGRHTRYVRGARGGTPRTQEGGIRSARTTSIARLATLAEEARTKLAPLSSFTWTPRLLLKTACFQGSKGGLSWYRLHRQVG